MLRIDFEPLETERFRATLDPLFDSNGVKVVRWSHTPGEISRNAELVNDGTHTISMLLPARATTVVKHLGREVDITAREAIMLRDFEPGSVGCTGTSSCTAVLIDAGLVQSSGRLKDDIIGRSLNATPALQLLKSYIRGLTHMRSDQRSSNWPKLRAGISWNS